MAAPRAACSSTASSRARSSSTSTRSATATTHVCAVMEHVEEAGIHSGDSSCVLPAALRLGARCARRSCSLGDRRRSASSGCSTSSSRSSAASPTCSRSTRARRAPSRSPPRRPGSTSSTPPAGSPPAQRSPSSSCRPRARRSRPPRQGGGASVPALPRRRRGARPRDALDRRGDGERRRLRDRVRRAERAAGARAARRRTRLRQRPRRRQGGGDRDRALLAELGFELVATRGTAAALRRMGIPAEPINKIGEGSPHVVDWIERGEVDLVVNTPVGNGAPPTATRSARPRSRGSPASRRWPAGWRRLGRSRPSVVATVPGVRR